jgi:hypothetical protein
MQYNLNDLGTRIQHLSDLHELWSSGLEIMLRGTYHSEPELELIKELEICLKHLTNHMAKDYGIEQVKYAKIINEIGTTPPPPEDSSS